MIKFASLFSGGGGADIGAIDAGLTPIWGIEYDKKIAGVYKKNIGNHINVVDILECDPASFERPDFLHMSPICTNVSVANNKAGETELDIALAKKCAEFIDVMKPTFVIVENVWQYRNAHHSWPQVRDALLRNGYHMRDLVDDYYNCADYGVPQTRKRMIVRASLVDMPPYLQKTHMSVDKKSKLPLIAGMYPSWVSWYEAIEDLIDDLEDAKLAKWQWERLVRAGYATRLINTKNPRGGDYTILDQSSPSCTVTSHSSSGRYKALIIKSTNKNSNGKPHRQKNEPSFTVDTNGHNHKAILLDGITSSYGTTVSIRDIADPSITIVASHKTLKAVLIPGGNSSNNQIISQDKPAHTLRSNRVDNANSRVVIPPYRIVKLSTRCLARFQTFPDSYELPDTKTLSCKVVGNAVPPLMFKQIAESLT